MIYDVFSEVCVGVYVLGYLFEFSVVDMLLIISWGCRVDGIIIIVYLLIIIKVYDEIV